jgi:primosomal protein N' (replication factor Y)
LPDRGGARSALFLPFPALRLIVVDEEHDGAFKQEDGFIYQGRDLAVARGKIEGAAVVLASATPSLETLANAQAGRYRWLKLAARHGAARLPEVELIDLRESPPERGRWLSPPLVQATAETLARGEQVLLFLTGGGTRRSCCARPAGTSCLRPTPTAGWSSTATPGG